MPRNHSLHLIAHVSEQSAELGIRNVYFHIVPDGVGNDIDLVSQTGEFDISKISLKASKRSFVETVRKFCPM
jgi:hypothetical protein